MKVIDFINKYKKLLAEENFETPLLDCKILIGEVLGIQSNELIFYFQKELKKNEEISCERLFQRRMNHEPIAKIINKKSFWNFDFFTNENVLDPRPDTEIIIEAILEDYNKNDFLNILDLGCGSGCIILTLLKLFENAKGVAIDKNEKSIDVAIRNADNLKVNNIEFRCGNWNDEVDELFDVVVSNPPYIPTAEINNLAKDVKNFDPTIALDGGVDGLECYKYIAKNIKKNCKNKTRLYFEIGQGQEKSIERIFFAENFKKIKIKKDLNNVERIMIFENITK